MDKPPFSKPFKQLQRAVGQNVAIARDTGDFADLAVFGADEPDFAALCKHMEDTLFVF